MHRVDRGQERRAPRGDTHHVAGPEGGLEEVRRSRAQPTQQAGLAVGIGIDDDRLAELRIATPAVPRDTGNAPVGTPTEIRTMPMSIA